MNRSFSLLAALLALGLADAAAQDRSGKMDKSERRDEKRDKSEKSDHPATPEKSPETKAPMAKSEGYDAFRNVRAKNIFDPSRRGPRIETPPTSFSSSSSSRGRSLALTGTMVADGNALAFFGGSAAEGSRVISVGNSVANYKVTAIAATQVSLEHEGKSITLDVGRQITFESSSGEPAAAGPVVEAATVPSADTTGAPSVPGVAGDKSEILRRMMERRAKEGGK